MIAKFPSNGDGCRIFYIFLTQGAGKSFLPASLFSDGSAQEQGCRLVMGTGIEFANLILFKELRCDRLGLAVTPFGREA